MSQSVQRTVAPERAALLAAVEDLRGLLAGGAGEAERLGTLPASSLEALAGAGLFLLKLPVELGGLEVDPVTHLEVIEALATIDAAAAWSAMIGSTSIGLLGAFLPDEAVAEIFAGGRIPRAAAVTTPAATVVPADGGFLVSGRWRFASGIRHSQWLAGGGLLPAADGTPPVHRMFVFPTQAAEIDEDWDVSGLAGTGSNDFTLPERFVPAAFTWEYLTGTPQRGGPLHHIRSPGHTANEHAAIALGIARCALDAIVDLAATKRRGYRPGAATLATRAAFQRTIGECDLRLRAARRLAIETFARVWEAVCEGRPIDARCQAEMRGVAALATTVALDVVGESFRYCGGEAMKRANVLGRCLRDMNAAAQHIAVSNVSYENLGQFVLGLPDANPRF